MTLLRLGYLVYSLGNHAMTLPTETGLIGLVWFCLRVTLTANYGVKQTQFTKPTSEPPR